MSTETKKNKTSSQSIRRRTSARLAAVQALYEMDIADITADNAVVNSLSYKMGVVIPADEDEEEQRLLDPDSDMLQRIVFGVSMRRDDLDRMIIENLSADWAEDRLELVLREILRAGIFELTHLDDIPPKVTITEYVDLAYAFYSGVEPKMVNAVLDRIAKQSRAEDMG